MDSLSSSLLSFLLLYRYAALAIIVYLCAIGVPMLPVNTILLAMGAFASQGYFNFWIVLGVAVVVNTMGDLTGYLLTRHYGDAIIRFLRIRRAKFFVNLEHELRVDAVVTIFMTRFAGTLSSITNLLAGIVGVPFRTFFWCDLSANIIEPFAWMAIGYSVGAYWSRFSGVSDIIATIFALSILVFILARIQYRINRRFRDEEAERGKQEKRGEA